jgi:hypothetical protein
MVTKSSPCRKRSRGAGSASSDLLDRQPLVGVQFDLDECPDQALIRLAGFGPAAGAVAHVAPRGLIPSRSTSVTRCTVLGSNPPMCQSITDSTGTP